MVAIKRVERGKRRCAMPKGGEMGRSGRGMGGPAAAGPVGECVCPACGHREPHVRGVPCVSMKCPKCSAVMTRA